jgi:hypothetical protein
MTPNSFKLAVFYQSLKSKVGLAEAKEAELRINLNIEGCCIVAAPVTLSLSLSPSPPPPSFTQSPSLPCSLVCDGQTGPHRTRLVSSHRTCPLLSPSPLHANRLMMMPVIGTAVINTHTQPDTTKHWLLGPTRNHVNPLIDGHGSRRSMRGLLDMVELSVTPWYSFNGP